MSHEDDGPPRRDGGRSRREAADDLQRIVAAHLQSIEADPGWQGPAVDPPHTGPHRIVGGIMLALLALVSGGCAVFWLALGGAGGVMLFGLVFVFAVIGAINLLAGGKSGSVQEVPANPPADAGRIESRIATHVRGKDRDGAASDRDRK